MAREAVTLIPADEVEGIKVDDIGDAFEEWRKGFESGEEPGKLRAYEIPIDERGNVMPTAKNQVRLGSWPIDLYGFDELCSMLIRDFMPATKTLAVRLIGTRPGRAGVEFNKIVVLRAPANSANGAATGPAGESVTTLMRTIQESNERTLALIQGMRPPPVPDNSLEKIIAMSQALNQPMMTMLSALLPALAGRSPSNGLEGLSGVIDLAGKIADLRGGGGDESTGNDLVDTIKAVVPLAKPAIEGFTEMMRRQPMPAGAVPALTGPNVPRTMPPGATPPRPAPQDMPRAAPPGSVPTQPPPAAVGVNPTPQLSDIPSGDQQMFAQLKPQIDALVQLAEQGSPADAAADLLFDATIMKLPDPFYGELADFIGQEKFVEKISVMNPAVSKHSDWFKQFQQQTMKRYDDEETAADEPTAANS